MELSVTTSRQDDVTVVTVAGEVDVYTAAQLRAALDEEIAAGRADLVVDLDDVTFLDSTGLGVLVGRLKLVRNQLRLAAPRLLQDRILKVFRITGLDKVFGIHTSVDEALAADLLADAASVRHSCVTCDRRFAPGATTCHAVAAG